MDNVRTPSDASIHSAATGSDVSSSMEGLQIAGDMLVDPYTQHEQENEVVDITPDADQNGEEQEESRVRADDCR